MSPFKHYEMHKLKYVPPSCKKGKGRQDFKPKDRGSNQQSSLLTYNQPLEEWKDDLNNNEVEQVIPQVAKVVLQAEYLEEQAYIIEIVHLLWIPKSHL